MSADRWSPCPQCAKNRDKSIDGAKQKADASYGKVSKEAYRKLLDAANPAKVPLGQTLREDWNISPPDEGGTLQILYSCSCQECNYGFDMSKMFDTFAK